MNKISKILLLTSALYSITLTADQEKLSLPDNLANKQVEYVKTKQLDGWSCGYNALLNACNVEQKVGNKNPYTKEKVFKNKLASVIASMGKHPRQSTSNKNLAKLSKKLNLKRTASLHLVNGKSELLLPKSVGVSFPGGTSKAKIQQLLKQAKADRQKRQLNKLVSYFNGKSKKAAVHFFSSVPGHWILTSVVKDNNGKKSIQVRDNLNRPIGDHSPIKKHIEFIANKFGI